MRRVHILPKNHFLAISIHAPIKGATGMALIITLSCGNFNPRTHKGCDIDIFIPTFGAKYFNPRTHKGVRPQYIITRYQHLSIYSAILLLHTIHHMNYSLLYHLLGANTLYFYVHLYFALKIIKHFSFYLYPKPYNIKTVCLIIFILFDS